MERKFKTHRLFLYALLTAVCLLLLPQRILAETNLYSEVKVVGGGRSCYEDYSGWNHHDQDLNNGSGGKYIYLLDAYDDLEKDAASGSFNPLLPVRSRMEESGGDFDSYVRSVLTMQMASCCRAFEALPIVENVDILRNILYAGVWTKFEEIYAQRTRQEETNVQDGDGLSGTDAPASALAEPSAQVEAAAPDAES